MKSFTRDNWYWRLADGRIWSSERAAFVPEDSAAFLAWTADGTTPSEAPDASGEASARGLREALAYYGLPLGELLTLDEARAAKLADVMAGYNAAFADLEKIYPQHEREGWSLQEAEARAIMADPTADTPVLSALVAIRGRGETVADLAGQVLTQASAYRAFYAWYTGQQQRMYGEISALSTVAEILAYQVAYAPPPDQGE